MKAVALRLAVAILASAPAVALACPTCATREGPGVGVFALLAGMVAVPYGAAVVVIRIIRKLERTRS